MTYHAMTAMTNRKKAVLVVEACLENPPMRGKKIAGDFFARYVVAMLIADGLLVTDPAPGLNPFAPTGNPLAAPNDDDAFPMRRQP